jgi:predicted DNA-binding transcriptional regulator AlpA
VRTTILTKKMFAAKIGRSVRHLERLISEGEGPPLVRLGVRAVGIFEADGDAWITSRRVLPPGWQDGNANGA